MARYSKRYSSTHTYYGFAPYVPVAERRKQAAKEVAKMAKKGMTVTPVTISGKKIAESFWGKSWCEHLESYSDYSNRLPRGRTYARNGSVMHLEVRSGEILAIVSGSSLYEVLISIAPVSKAKWNAICNVCAGGVGSLVELLQAKLSSSVMAHISDRKNGLFPAPSEIKIQCSCPDYAGLCKHAAATLYGVGNRLDLQPELLFQLRSVDAADLITHAAGSELLQSASTAGGSPEIDESDLSSIFGIEMESSPSKTPETRAMAKKKKPASAKKAAPRKSPSAKKAVKTASKQPQARVTKAPKAKKAATPQGGKQRKK